MIMDFRARQNLDLVEADLVQQYIIDSCDTTMFFVIKQSFENETVPNIRLATDLLSQIGYHTMSLLKNDFI